VYDWTKVPAKSGDTGRKEAPYTSPMKPPSRPTEMQQPAAPLNPPPADDDEEQGGLCCFGGKKKKKT